MQQDFEEILATASEFSTSSSPSPAMVKREDALDRAEAELADVVKAFASANMFPLKVKKGGRQANFGPTAWLRIYSPAHSRGATAGFYLVYLFAGDGSRMYLSLNQGTSEFRSGQMRPINDAELLRWRAAQARRVLADQEQDETLRRATIAIDLGSEAVAVSDLSRHRVHNYEDANLYALGYQRGAVPHDEVLVADLNAMLPHLLSLYEASPFMRPSEGAGAGVGGPTLTLKPRPGARTGGLMDPEMRRALEVFAEDAAIAHLDEWTVTRVGHLKLGYDLDCRRGNEHLHLEVKGTSTRGEEVLLTANEVQHLEAGGCAATHGLFVLSGVLVTKAPDGTVTCEGQDKRLLLPWLLDPKSLSATQYVYRMPLALAGASVV